MWLANSIGPDYKWSWSMSEGNFLLCDPNKRLLETCHESAVHTYRVVHSGQLTNSKYHRHVASIVPAKLMWSNDQSTSSWYACHQVADTPGVKILAKWNILSHPDPPSNFPPTSYAHISKCRNPIMHTICLSPTSSGNRNWHRFWRA